MIYGYLRRSSQSETKTAPTGRFPTILLRRNVREKPHIARPLYRKGKCSLLLGGERRALLSLNLTVGREEKAQQVEVLVVHVLEI